MDNLKQFFSKVGVGLRHFWTWIKPYLIQFHQARKRIWKKYQINKIFLLIRCQYLFILLSQVRKR